MKIAAFSIGDYCDATFGLDHMAERLFFRMLMWMYSTEAMIPDNDRDNATRFGYHLTRYRALKAKLLDAPKNLIALRDGKIVSDRAIKEIALVQARKESAREAGRRGGYAKAGRPAPSHSEAHATLELPFEVDDFSGSNSGVFSDASPPENMTSAPSTPAPSPAQRRSEIQKEIGPVRPPQIVSENLKSAFGAKEAAKLVEAVGFALPDHCEVDEAADWLEAEVATNGAVVVRAAHQMMDRKIKGGEKIRNRLAWWSKTAGTLAMKSTASLKRDAEPNARLDAAKREMAVLKARWNAESAGSVVAYA